MKSAKHRQVLQIHFVENALEVEETEVLEIGELEGAREVDLGRREEERARKEELLKEEVGLHPGADAREVEGEVR